MVNLLKKKITPTVNATKIHVLVIHVLWEFNQGKNNEATNIYVLESTIIDVIYKEKYQKIHIPSALVPIQS